MPGGRFQAAREPWILADRSTKLLSRCPLFLVLVRRLRTFLSSAVTCCSPEREIRSIHPPREGGRAAPLTDRRPAGRRARSLAPAAAPFSRRTWRRSAKKPFHHIFRFEKSARGGKKCLQARHPTSRGSRSRQICFIQKFSQPAGSVFFGPVGVTSNQSYIRRTNGRSMP